MAPFRLALTERQFWLVNAVFVALCILTAVVSSYSILVSLSVPLAVFVNVWLHVGVAVRMQAYAAGLVTALALYLPLSVLAFYTLATAGLLDPMTVLGSVALTLIGYSVLFSYLTISSRINSEPKERRQAL